MRFLIVGDAHIDYTNASDWYLHQLSTNFRQIIKIVEERKIKDILFVGDFFDRRSHVNNKALAFVFDNYFREIGWGAESHFILGNHDMYHKDVVYPNSLQLLIPETCPVYTEIRDWNGVTIVPWICKENYQQIMDFIEKDTNKYCIGHFEFAGFPMMKGGQPMQHGMDASLFSKYELVISGHYHTSSRIGNVLYTGSMNQMTKADMNDPKKIFIFDDGKLEEIILESEYFVSLNLSKSTPLEIKKDLYLRNVYLTVERGCEIENINIAKQLINEKRPNNLVVEDLNIVSVDTDDVHDDIIVEKDTFTLITEVIDNSDLEGTNLDKEILKKKIKELF